MNDSVTDEISKELRKLSPPERHSVLQYIKNLVSSGQRKVDWVEFEQAIGSIPSENIREMERIIDEGCEQIDNEGW